MSYVDSGETIPVNFPINGEIHHSLLGAVKRRLGTAGEPDRQQDSRSLAFHRMDDAVAGTHYPDVAGFENSLHTIDVVPEPTRENIEDLDRIVGV